MIGHEWHEEKKTRILSGVKIEKFGISFLDDALLGLFPTDLMLIGARTGRGKTELATTLALNLADRGVSVAFYALEADRWEIQRRLKYREMARIFFEHLAITSAIHWPRYSEWLAQGVPEDWQRLEAEAEDALKTKTDSLRIIYKGGKYTVDDFVHDLEINDDRVVIVDHLHYFDLDGRNETEGLKKAVHAIRDAALFRENPVILLSHLRKSEKLSGKAMPSLDDFHGHSDIVKVATTVLILSPAPQEKAEGLGSYPTYFHIAKSRRASENTPYVGLLGFDKKTNSYSSQYLLFRHSDFEEPALLEAHEIPDWFKKAKRAHYAQRGFI